MIQHTRKAAALAAILSTASLAYSQAISSPRGLLTTEGSGAHSYVLGSAPNLRFQQLDATQRGSTRTIKSLAFRRDGVLPTNAAFVARTLRQVSIRMGHGQVDEMTKNLDSNGSKVLVFAARDVNTPDWRTKPVSGTAPFDFSMTLDRPFVYNGTEDLLWEITTGGPTVAPTTLRNYAFDFEAGTQLTRRIVGTSLGNGCLSSGRSPNEERFALGTEFANHGGNFRMIYGVNYAPDGAAVLAFLGFRDANLTVPGLCTTLHAEPTVILTIGVATLTGSAPAVTANFPHVPSAIGANLFLQAVAVDPTQTGSIKLALSQGTRMQVPANPPAPTIAHAFEYRTPAGSTFSMFASGGIVTRLGL